MDNGLDAIATCQLAQFANGGRVIIEGRLIERPFIRRKVDARPPVFEPNIVAMVQERIDEVYFDGSPKQIRSHACAVNQKHWPAFRLLRTNDMDQVQMRPVIRLER
jgi:hypothetical protein